MKTIRVTVVHEVQAPDEATHYAGDLLDEPTWWKYSENDTGTFKGWCYYDPNRGAWFIGADGWKPDWIKEIPTS